ncbi:ABC transporter ATP-binding protein [Enterococcus sp. HY326]|uniref:ABC transporter ATP-binding protein n=1 Tax=Enterococcus sp. HY326 TaxID=2971265 RepID=UPI00224043A2|nr:ABC transporter ATP-binding protein [Enterococcus sp. HY326]
MELLTVDKVTKNYPSFTLADISLQIAAGSIVGLIGTNGAGKTTLLKAILNLIPIDQGNIALLGKDQLTQEIAWKQQTGVVLGGVDYYQEKKLKVITATTKRFYPNWQEDTYQKYMRLFGLNPEKKVKELSAGMKVKYNIALALSHQAKLFIFDEPTSGLDPVSRDDLLVIFKQLTADGSRGILFSTHITSDLEKSADWIVYLKEGKLIQAAEKAEFIASFQYLKETPKEADLSLEEIMVRMEGKHYDF